jgi:HEAT repeat protein
VNRPGIGYIGRPRGETARQLEPILADLRRIGYDVETLGQLPSRGRRLRDAVPILLEWLPRVTDPGVRESLVRALSVREARPAAIGPLVREFEETENDMHRWAVGNALEVVADDRAFDDLERIVREPRYGKAREMVVMALGNMKKRRDDALRLLTELLDDDELAQHALLGLEKLGDPRAIPAVERMTEHEDRWLRTCAKKTLEKLRR